MAFVSKRDDIVDNLKTLEKLLHSKKKEEKDFARELVRKAQNVVLYKVEGENHFAPASFVAFKGNSMKDHEKNMAANDDKGIDSIISKVVGRPFFNDKTEEKYIAYASALAKDIPSHKRTYWRVKDERGKNLDLK